MYNDFVIVGPKSDPAGILGLQSAAEALDTIAAGAATFLSRGDDSGTHKTELALWREAGLDPAPQSGTWYRELGAGMGASSLGNALSEEYNPSARDRAASFFGADRGLSRFGLGS